MKLSTNYVINADISHIGYYGGDDSFTFYTDDDEQIEIYGVKRGGIFCFVRNFLVCDVTKHTARSRIEDNELRLLTEIRDALTEYIEKE
jgi:hypothetical protein